MLRLFTTIFLASILVACNKADEPANAPAGPTADPGSQTFDKAKWQQKVDMDYKFREDMYQSLLKSDTLKSLKKPGIIAMLGDPDRIDNNHLFYNISRKRVGFVTLHTRTMVIKLRPDEKVEWVKIHE